MKKTNERAEIVSYNLDSFEMPALIELSEMDLSEVSGGASADPECGAFACGTFGCIAFDRPEV